MFIKINMRQSTSGARNYWRTWWWSLCSFSWCDWHLSLWLTPLPD